MSKYDVKDLMEGKYAVEMFLKDVYGDKPLITAGGITFCPNSLDVAHIDNVYCTNWCEETPSLDIDTLLNEGMTSRQAQAMVRKYSAKIEKLRQKQLKIVKEITLADAIKCSAEMILAYKKFKPVKFCRKWKRDKERDNAITKVFGNSKVPTHDNLTISNSVYKAFIDIKYYTLSNTGLRIVLPLEEKQKASYVDVGCEVSHRAFEFNRKGGLEQKMEPIFQTTKTFDSVEQAKKYIEQQKKKFERIYFKEDNPLVPIKYAESFMITGKVLPGYRLDNGST